MVPTIDYVEKKVNELRNAGKPVEVVDLFGHLQNFLAMPPKTVSVSTLKGYRLLGLYLKEFEVKYKYPVSFERITSSFYERFVIYLSADRKMNPNSVGEVIKVLKSFLSKMAEKKINQNLDYKDFKKPESVPIGNHSPESRRTKPGNGY